MIRIITAGITKLNKERLVILNQHLTDLLNIDDNLLQEKEEHAIKELGFNPSSTVSDHEWEAMQKRNQLSLDMEKISNR